LRLPTNGPCDPVLHPALRTTCGLQPDRPY